MFTGDNGSATVRLRFSTSLKLIAPAGRETVPSFRLSRGGRYSYIVAFLIFNRFSSSPSLPASPPFCIFLLGDAVGVNVPVHV